MNAIRTAALLAAAALASAASASAQIVHFTSPSRNLDCMMFLDENGRPGVSCDAERATWARPKAKPHDCPLEWVAANVTLEKGRVSVGSCRGDIGPLCLPPSAHESNPCRVLAYGRSARLKTLRCTSTRLGVTCRLRNGAGVGFRIAREGYRRF